MRGEMRVYDTSDLPHDYAWYVKFKHQDERWYYKWDVAWGGIEQNLLSLTLVTNKKGGLNWKEIWKQANTVFAYALMW